MIEASQSQVLKWEQMTPSPPAWGTPSPEPRALKESLRRTEPK